MRLLPSEQQERLQSAIDKFVSAGQLVIEEPCNCGSQVRHNNGGNYHAIITLVKDEGKYFVKYDNTCELTPPAEWEDCDDWQKVIKQYVDWF